MNGCHDWPLAQAIAKAREIAPEVANSTDQNCHTEARRRIASAFGLTSDAAWLDDLADKQIEKGQLTSADIHDRTTVTLNIFRAINQQWPTGEVTAILDRCL